MIFGATPPPFTIASCVRWSCDFTASSVIFVTCGCGSGGGRIVRGAGKRQQGKETRDEDGAGHRRKSEIHGRIQARFPAIVLPKRPRGAASASRSLPRAGNVSGQPFRPGLALLC